MSYQITLNSRLKNCLDTILELENLLVETSAGESMQTEFSVLRDVFNRLSDMTVSEQDVCQIEAATTRFLNEIRQTLAISTDSQEMGTRNLQ